MIHRIKGMPADPIKPDSGTLTAVPVWSGVTRAWPAAGNHQARAAKRNDCPGGSDIAIDVSGYGQEGIKPSPPNTGSIKEIWVSMRRG